MSVWEICELMKYLQDDPTGDQERLVRLEWRLLPLARHNDFVPKILHSELSQNPGFFVEVLTAIFRSKNEPKEENEKTDPARQALWQAAYHLLESWTGIPGKKSDGTIDSSVLNDWVIEARKLNVWPMGESKCAIQKLASDFLMLRLTRMVLGRAKPFVRYLKPSKQMKFCADSILVFSMSVALLPTGMRDGGEQERDLVKKYRASAEQCKVQWPRTGIGASTNRRELRISSEVAG